MREKFHKFFDAITHNYKVTPVNAEWPIAMIILGVAITPAWAALLFWFLYHWLTLQISR